MKMNMKIIILNQCMIVLPPMKIINYRYTVENVVIHFHGLKA